MDIVCQRKMSKTQYFLANNLTKGDPVFCVAYLYNRKDEIARQAQCERGKSVRLYVCCMEL